MDAPTAAAKSLTDRDLRLFVVGSMLPVFMGAMDNTILANALPPGSAEAAEAFRRVFFTVAVCLSIYLIAVVMIEQRPLRTTLPDRTA